MGVAAAGRRGGIAAVEMIVAPLLSAELRVGAMRLRGHHNRRS
jgi:hypothetical protein